MTVNGWAHLSAQHLKRRCVNGSRIVRIRKLQVKMSNLNKQTSDLVRNATKANKKSNKLLRDANELKVEIKRASKGN